DIISYGIRDYTGDKKDVPYFIPSGGTIASAQALADTTAPLIDLATDGKIMNITMTIQLTVPSGLKSAPAVGNTVHEGALIDFSVVGSIYRWGTYFPSWKNSLFNVNDVVNAGAGANVITDLNQFVDKYNNALDAYLQGVRKF